MEQAKHHRVSRILLPFLALLSWMAAACAGESVAATQVLVVVNSDLQIGTQLTAVEVEIQRADGTAEKPYTKRFDLSDVVEEGRFRLPLSFGVVPGKGGSDNIRLVVRGMGPGAGGVEAVVVEQKSLVTFERQASLRLTVFLGGACFRVLCPNSEQTCYPSGQAAIGVCTAVTEAELEKVKPGNELDGIVLPTDDADAGSDAGGKQDAAPVAQGMLSVELGGDGSGTVTSSAAGIDCGATCSAWFDLGSSVTLTATAGENSEFTGWAGGPCTGTDPCVVPVAAATTVAATFMKTHYPLHVTMSGDGVGVVSSGAAEISCGSDCEDSFARGAVVQLTAATTAGTVFLGWNGGGCSGVGPCSVTMNAATDVAAIFACVAAAGSQSFGYTGAPQALSTRPLCKRTIMVDVWGAAGGYGFEYEYQNPNSVNISSGARGYGGRVQATLTLGATDTVTVVVGGTGANASTTSAGLGGYNGGGNGTTQASGYYWGGGGGGATDIRLNVEGTLGDPATEQLEKRVVVAGGGGGGVGCSTISGGIQGGMGGGVGGNPNGASPSAACYPGNSSIAAGGTQEAGGSSGQYPGYTAGNGAAGKGGSGPVGAPGGGGGGGFFGGGGGGWEAGAGGSSYAISSATGVTFTNESSYSGYVTISW